MPHDFDSDGHEGLYLGTLVISPPDQLHYTCLQSSVFELGYGLRGVLKIFAAYRGAAVQQLLHAHSLLVYEPCIGSLPHGFLNPDTFRLSAQRWQTFCVRPCEVRIRTAAGDRIHRWHRVPGFAGMGLLTLPPTAGTSCP